VILEFETPLEVVGEWRHEGPIDDGAVLARLKLRRPTNSAPLDLVPTFAHLPTLQISDDPVEFRSLASGMDVLRGDVLKVITSSASILGLPPPDPSSLELGKEHEAFATEHGGIVATFQEHDGTIRRFSLPSDEPNEGST
jgi:hypothetical protein